MVLRRDELGRDMEEGELLGSKCSKRRRYPVTAFHHLVGEDTGDSGKA